MLLPLVELGDLLAQYLELSCHCGGIRWWRH
jgi:hypothetical protein